MTQRAYTLPAHLLEQMDSSTHLTSRTAIIRNSVKLAYSDPQVLVDSLIARMSSKEPNNNEGIRVTASVGDICIRQLAELTRMTRLGTEHALRLAIEAYLRRLDKSHYQPTGSTDEAVPDLPGAQEGGNHP